MTYNKQCVTYLLVAVLWAGSAQAQGQKDFDPLALVTAQMLRCMVLPVTPADSADVVIRFVDDGESFFERETILAYDAAGTPLYLTLSAVDSVPGRPGVLYGFAARFQPKPAGVRGPMSEEAVMPRRIEPGSASEDGDYPPGWRDATPEELERARSLALDFWKRRCGKRS